MTDHDNAISTHMYGDFDPRPASILAHASEDIAAQNIATRILEIAPHSKDRQARILLKAMADLRVVELIERELMK